MSSSLPAFSHFSTHLFSAIRLRFLFLSRVFFVHAAGTAPPSGGTPLPLLFSCLPDFLIQKSGPNGGRLYRLTETGGPIILCTLNRNRTTRLL
jgi:hypothetical protein